MNENNANFTPAAPNFKTLVKMSFQGLTNFPYIEEDFDALTNYGLLSKVVEYLNTVISNNNEQNTLMTNLYNAYVSLQDYVNNYFDNLDVQEEINNKLDKMAQDGSLTALIKSYVDPYINQQNIRIDNIENLAESLASGSPKGVYSTVSALESANPATGVYIVSADGHIYSWTKDGSNAIDLGVYQSTGIADKSISQQMLTNGNINFLKSSDVTLDLGTPEELTLTRMVLGAFNNTNGVYTPYSSDRFVKFENPIKLPSNRVFKLKAKQGYLITISIYEKVGNVYNLVNNGTIGNFTYEINYRNVNDYYLCLEATTNGQAQVLNADNWQDYFSITSSSVINEVFNYINGTESSNETYTETHELNINDLEIKGQIEKLILNEKTLTYNPSNMWASISTIKENITIETKLNGASNMGLIIIGETECNYLAIRLFANKGALYTISKALNQQTIPSESNYFDVNDAWNTLTINSRLKLEKAGTDLTIYKYENGAYTEVFSYDKCNHLGFINSDSFNNPLYDTKITLTHKKGTKGLVELLTNIENKVKSSNKEISILFVGNSLTQDAISYLPYLLVNYYPEINFKFYMWYNGGYTLEQQYQNFINDVPCEIFSVAENTASWNNTSKTMRSILNTYTFDIVCMQEYFNYKTSYNNVSDWNNCKDFITSNYIGSNSLEFISLFHAPLRSNATNVFNLTKDGNNLILKDTISEDIIPVGIAVYRALSTSLDSLGDQGHLSPDGTHTQEGLPCLLQTYVALLWVLEKMGINKSIYGSKFKMTTSIYNSINVPGPNLGSGVITGTDEQNLLAQEVAIKAYKEGKKEVIDNLSNY